jgi:hypothetical protein
MGRIALATDLRSRDGTLAKDARIVNGYVERDGEKLHVFKRPAIALADATFAGLGMGLFEHEGNAYSVVSNKVVKYQSFTVPSDITVNTDASATFGAILNHAGALYGFTSDGESVYRKTTAAGSWSLITASAGMGNITGNRCVASVGGLMWVADQSTADTLWYSGDGSAWTSVDVTVADNEAFTAITAVNGSLYAWQTARLFTSATPTSGASFVDAGAISGDDGFNAAYMVVYKDGVLYRAGGFDGVAYTDNVYSSTTGLAWTSVTTAPGFTNRGFVAMGVLAGTLIVAGGFSNGATNTSDVWYSTDNGATWTELTSAAPDTNTVAWGAVLGTKFVFGSGANEWYIGEGSETYESTSLGAVVGGGTSASFAASGSTVFVKTENAAYTWNGSALTRVTDAQYPANTVRGAPYLNGIFYVMDADGTIWGSAEDDATSWAADNFVTAEFEPDGGVCLAKLVSNIVALGTYTTEMFFDAGNTTGSALSPVQSDPLLIGCAHANTVAQTESFLTWVAQQKAQGTTFHRGRFVVVMSGPAYKRISTPDVERILDADAFDDVYGEIITVSGHMFYVLTMVASAITIVYDFKEGLWYEWKKGTAGTSITITALTQSGGTATATATAHGLSDGDQVTVSGANQAGYNLTVNVTRTDADTFTYPVAAATVSPATGSPVAANWTQGVLDVSGSCNFAGNQAIQLRSTGAVYVFDPDDTDDGGVPIDFQCITENQDGGNNLQKFMSRLELVGDKVSSTALVRYSDDDYASWSTYRRMDMSLPRVGVNRLGDFHRRAIQIRHTLSAKARVEALEADVEQGG